MSATPVFKDEEDDQATLASSPGPSTNDEPEVAAEENERKRPKTGAGNGGSGTSKKPTEEVLQRRREGRLKAAATMAQNLKKTGIGRFEEENGFALTSVKTIPLINQKNYIADYLKKEEQFRMVRNWRAEKQRENGARSGGGEGKKIGGEDENDDEDENENDNDNENEHEHENENENDEEGRAVGADTLVLQPGSQFLRIGRATDSFPTMVPMVVAVPSVNLLNKDDDGEEEYPVVPARTVYEDGDFDFGEKFASAKAMVTKDFKARMRFYKRRMMPNSRESAANFNRTQKPEVVPDNADPDYKEFFEPNDARLADAEYFVGDDALRLPLGPNFTSWRLRYPVVNGTLNQDPQNYASPQELMGDLVRLVEAAVRAVGVSVGDVQRLKCVLLIPDLYEKEVVETWVELLLRQVGFLRIGVIQESVAATFGAGSSCACVVDVGAQKTSVSCVDEGMVISDSRVSLAYGGENVTETFAKLLLQQEFPCQDINLYNRNDDWELADRLKRNFGTFDDADIAVQLYHFYRRRAGGRTEKYNLKVFDEAMLAPLGLFHPDLFELSKAPRLRALLPEPYDHYTGEPNNPFSQAQENLARGGGVTEIPDDALLLKIIDDKQAFKSANAAYGKPAPTRPTSTNPHPVVTPLDKAIIESITNAGIATDFNKARKLYDNILVVGGGLAKFPGFDTLLNDRINIWRPRFLSTSSLDDILSYVGKEKDRLDTRRKQLVTEAKAKKKANLTGATGDDVELTENELRKIDAETTLTIDLEKADAVADDGAVVAVNVLPSPKELDPQVISWTGGSVYARLKVVNEMWITRDDWECLNSRCLYYKSLFNY